MADSPICRGCGGDGIDHSVSARERQMLRGIWYGRKPSSFNGVTSNQVVSLEIVPVDSRSRKRLMAVGPVADVLDRMTHYESLGFAEFDHTREELEAIKCSWCFGTGVPQLSAHTLEALVAR